MEPLQMLVNIANEYVLALRGQGHNTAANALATLAQKAIQDLEGQINGRGNDGHNQKTGPIHSRPAPDKKQPE